MSTLETTVLLLVGSYVCGWVILWAELLLCVGGAVVMHEWSYCACGRSYSYAWVELLCMWAELLCMGGAIVHMGRAVMHGWSYCACGWSCCYAWVVELLLYMGGAIVHVGGAVFIHGWSSFTCVVE